MEQFEKTKQKLILGQLVLDGFGGFNDFDGSDRFDAFAGFNCF